MTSPVSAVEAIEKAMEGVTPCGYQRRPRYEHRSATVSGTPWVLCGREEATNMFERDPRFEYRPIYDAETVLALARQAEALRENAEKDAEASWYPITTCPIREPVDLWCVYGGEEFAEYDGGASIGKLVPNRHKTEEYGFFGNQSNDGVPQGHAPDLIPVAWRKAVPQCPSELIAEVLGIPRTLEDARALLGGSDAE